MKSIVVFTLSLINNDELPLLSSYINEVPHYVINNLQKNERSLQQTYFPLFPLLLYTIIRELSNKYYF